VAWVGGEREGVLAWVRDRDELCPCPSYQGVRGGVDLPAWVREGGELYLWGPLSLLVSVS
jgi:hypothetical protein